MSAHFDGGAEIAGRRLREVEVMYVDDETLNLDAEDSDDCPPSPPPTYYLRVRDEKGAKQGEEGTNGNLEATEQVSSVHLPVFRYVCMSTCLVLYLLLTPSALRMSFFGCYFCGSSVIRECRVPGISVGAV